MRRAAVLALPLWAAIGASPGTAYHTPTEGNQLSTLTREYLFVVWALPRDLAPLAPVAGDPGGLEAFVARTAIHLCARHREARSVADRPCKVQVLRMRTNDEYSRSASSGFTTVGRLELPIDLATGEALERSLPLKADELRGWFTRFELHLDDLQP